MGYIITSSALNNQHFHLTQLWNSFKCHAFSQAVVFCVSSSPTLRLNSTKLN